MISRVVFGLLVLCSMQSIAKQDVLAGYFHNWSSEAYNYTLDQVQANKLTHLLYQCAQVSQQSTIELCDDFLDSAIWYEQDANPLYRGGLGQLLKLKHQHPKLKTLISVGGWYRSSQYSTMAKSYESRQRFIQSVLALLAQYQLDGIEFNWQFPGLSTADKTDVDAQDGENFLLLLQEFRAAMQAENLEYIVMVVAGVDNETSGNWPLRHIAAWVDYAVINAGYMNGAWSYVTGHISPLYQNPNAPDFYNNVHRTVEWLANQGLPREQMILMIPSHAAGWQKIRPRNDGLFQAWRELPKSSRKNVGGEPSGMYSLAQANELSQQANSQLIWDDSAKAHYIYNSQERLMVSFESQRSMAEKLNYIDRHGLAGVVFSELNKSDKSPYSLLDLTFAHQHPFIALLQSAVDFWLQHWQSIVMLFLLLLSSSLLVWQGIRRRAKQRIEAQEQWREEIEIAAALSEIRLMYSKQHAGLLANSNHSLDDDSENEQHRQTLAIAHAMQPKNSVKLRPRALSLNAFIFSLTDAAIWHAQLPQQVHIISDARALLSMAKVLAAATMVRVEITKYQCQLAVQLPLAQALQLIELTQLWQLPIEHEHELLRLTWVLAPKESKHYLAANDSVASLQQSIDQQHGYLMEQPQLLDELHQIASRKEQIRYIRSEQGYSALYGKKSSHARHLQLSLKTIKEFVKDEHLLQVHRSWLVNPNKVLRAQLKAKSKTSYELIIGDELVPIGSGYVNSLMTHYPDWFIMPMPRRAVRQAS